MTQKIASKVTTIVTLVAANKAPGAITSSAVTLATYNYPRYARVVISGTVTGGTLDGYITDNASGSHVKISGSDATQLTSNSTSYGPEVKISSGATEIKTVVTLGTVTEGICAFVELSDRSFDA